jgi:hypothetical protein
VATSVQFRRRIVEDRQQGRRPARKTPHDSDTPERGAALFEQLGANAQRAAQGSAAKSPAAGLREKR